MMPAHCTGLSGVVASTTAERGHRRRDAHSAVKKSVAHVDGHSAKKLKGTLADANAA